MFRLPGHWRRALEGVFSSSQDGTRAAQAREVREGLSFASWAGQAAESLFAVLFPSDCRLCGAPLIRISRLPVCEECLDTIRPLAGGVCSVCGERLVSPYAVSGARGEPRCGLCRRIDPPFARALAYGSYEGGLRELIHLLKYGQVRPAANVLGRMLAEVIAELEKSFADGSVLVVPVPLHAAKQRQRGFNQAELIVRAALKLRRSAGSSSRSGEGSRVSEDARLHLLAGALERRRETRSQTGLTSHQRRENLRGAFVVTAPHEVEGREVLVVDDVYTTGTTVSECARVLRRAGATRVWVATVARTLKIAAQHAQMPPESDIVESDVQMSRAAHG